MRLYYILHTLFFSFYYSVYYAENYITGRYDLSFYRFFVTYFFLIGIIYFYHFFIFLKFHIIFFFFLRFFLSASSIILFCWYAFLFVVALAFTPPGVLTLYFPDLNFVILTGMIFPYFNIFILAFSDYNIHFFPAILAIFQFNIFFYFFAK